MSNTLRQCLILQRVPRHPRKVTIRVINQWLMDQGVEVTLRTTERDLNSLSTIFPLVSDSNKPQGWSWAPDADSFYPPHMDTPTAFTFIMLKEFLAKALPPASIEALTPHFDRAESVLKTITNKHWSAWPDKVKILSRGQPLRPPDIPQDVLDTVYECLMEGKRFTATYRRRGEEVTVSYAVNPLGIVFLDAVIYLVCTMRDYHRLTDIRQLALHRILSAEKTEEEGLQPEGFDLQGYIESGAFNYIMGSQSLRLQAAFQNGVATHLFETPLSEDQTLTPLDSERILLTATVHDTAQLRWWLLGFGDKVEVLDPPCLRDAFRDTICSMHALYS